MRSLLIPALLGAAVNPGYVHEVQTWRMNYEAGLRAPTGWLSVAGLEWLHEGENRVDLPSGATERSVLLTLKGEQVTHGGRVLKDDDVLPFGAVNVAVIRRGDRIGARIRDLNAHTRRDYKVSAWYPIDPKWNVAAKWTAAPKKISIVNILGMREDQDSPGTAEFTLEGKPIRLEPIVDENQLFFIFKDQTSGRTTYGAGRYLYASMPQNGIVHLDFNKAKNPPCAFIAFATCPLPPRQNAIPIALAAGEMKYGDHH